MDSKESTLEMEDGALPIKGDPDDILDKCDMCDDIIQPTEHNFKLEGHYNQNLQVQADTFQNTRDDDPFAFTEDSPPREHEPNLIRGFFRSDSSGYVSSGVEMSANFGHNIDSGINQSVENPTTVSNTLYTKYCKNMGYCSPNNVIKCPLCSFTDMNSKGLAEHIIIEHLSFRDHTANELTLSILLNRLPFICQACGLKSKRYENVRYLIQNPRPNLGNPDSKTSKKLFPCPECSLVFNIRSNLNKHSRKHSDERPFPCPECSYKAKKNSHLKTHVENVHRKTKVVEPKKTYSCPYCPNVFENAGKFLEHSYKHSGITPYTCDICGKRNKTAGRLKNHMKKHQDGLKDKLEKRAMQKCPHCPYVNFFESRLAEHIKIHEGEHPFECDECDFKAKSEELLMIHRAIHQNGKLFKCTKCDYSTNREKTLTNHMKFHARGKTYPCELCSSTFIDSTYLNQHMANVHNQKRFKCPELNCDYATDAKASLGYHKKHHQGEPKRLCRECGYKCHTYGQMVNHETSHFGNGPFKCPDCKFISVELRNMRRHRRGGGRGNTCIRVKS